jgi:drug/metabolite transporter (DMT)-like permease
VSYTGEWAAVATALLWVGSAMGFEAAGKRIGSLAVNLIRLWMGIVLLSLYTALTRGLPFPSDATGAQWGWLALSGFFGFVFGDLCLFQAFIDIGARRALLMMALWPAMAGSLSWLLLGETLRAVDLIGIAVTLGGILFVVAARAGKKPAGAVAVEAGAEAGAEAGVEPVPPARPPLEKHEVRGFGLAFLGALGQASGIVFSKIGMDGYNPVAATQIRVWAAIVCFMLGVTALRKWGAIAAGLKDRAAMIAMLIGAICGPFIGVSLSLYAVQHAKAGVASTLMALTPVFILPFAKLINREEIGWRAVVGALVAVSGVAVLFLG